MTNTKATAVDRAGMGNVYSTVQKNTTSHKSLDFSNIGMPQDTVSGKQASADRALRQFHQTRIYIQGFNNMRSHNKELNSGNDSNSTYLISANLPEQISYSIGSKWEAPLSAFGGATQNALMQLASGTKLSSMIGLDSKISGVNRATTLRVWGGSEPLKLSLKIPVIDDNANTGNGNGISTNLVEALEYLGSLCLPAKDANMGFYVPPPSPLNVNIKYGKGGDESIHLSSTFGRIMVQLGGILLIDNCIIEKVSVSYPNTKTQIKHTYTTADNLGTSGNVYLTPLLAEVTLEISTIEAMTASVYSQMLWMKSQTTGSFNADFSPVIEAAKEMGNAAMNKVKEWF